MNKRIYQTTTNYHDANTHVSLGESRGFTFKMDPKHIKEKQDEAMTPIEAFLNSISGCQLAVIGTYKNIKRIKINNIRIETIGERIDDPKNRDDFGMTLIEQHFFIDSPEDKNKLIDFINFINKLCPLHATISKAVKTTFFIHEWE